MASPTTFDAFKAVLDAYAAGEGALPVVYENVFYRLPDTPAPFVYVEVFGDSYNQETMGAPGANMWEERGVTFLHVMVQAGTGTSAARGYANDLLYLFREQPIGELFMPEMSIGAGEPGQDFPNYFAVTATIHWVRRDITSIPTP